LGMRRREPVSGRKEGRNKERSEEARGRRDK
jgi:hypothetical protein